jgi:hypothetical protein
MEELTEDQKPTKWQWWNQLPTTAKLQDEHYHRKWDLKRWATQRAEQFKQQRLNEDRGRWWLKTAHPPVEQMVNEAVLAELDWIRKLGKYYDLSQDRMRGKNCFGRAGKRSRGTRMEGGGDLIDRTKTKTKANKI